jgi:hypothetical protein
VASLTHTTDATNTRPLSDDHYIKLTRDDFVHAATLSKGRIAARVGREVSVFGIGTEEES